MPPLAEVPCVIECQECGCNLTDLPLPHPCPECGVLCDPASYPHAVLEWYKSWRGFFFLRVPAHAAAYLHDSECRRIVCRRLLIGIVLPWLLATGALVLLNGVTITAQVEVSWAYPNKPDEPIASYPVTRKDRVLAFNLHMFEGPGLLGYRPPLGAVSRERWVSATATFAWPNPAQVDCLWPMMPNLALAGLFGLLTEAWLLGRLTAARRMRITSRWALIPAFAVVYIPTVLLIAVAALCAFLTLRFDLSPGVTIVILGLAAGVNVVGAAVQGLRLLRACRPRHKSFPAPIRLAIFVVLLAYQPGAWLLVMWLIEGH